MKKKQQHHTNTTPSLEDQRKAVVDQLMTPNTPDQFVRSETHPSNNLPLIGHEAGTPLGIPTLGSSTI